MAKPAGVGPTIAVAWLGGMLAAGWVMAPSPAFAQPFGGLGRGAGVGLPAVGGVVSTIGATGEHALSDVGDAAGAGELTLRRDLLRALVRANPKTLDVDDKGAPVVRGEVLADSPSPRALEAARAAGFSIKRRTQLEALGMDVAVIVPPDGMSVRQAVERLRRLDPTGRYDFDHIYSSAGELGGAVAEAVGTGAPAESGRVRIGLLDTGVSQGHPAFATSTIEQRGFAPGGVQAGAHGTAVASLMVGQAGRFRGAAPGAGLYVADVYGAGPTGGSAETIARALAWMVETQTPVINVSLVGPPNLTLQMAVQAVLAKGEAIVAPVGNDGPAAPPLYPGSYPGVIAVTAVDARDRVLFEAGRARHLDFAAPGAGIVAASPSGGFVTVRGTSFAAPIVSARLALLMPAPGQAARDHAVDALARQADHRGSGGYGRGLVGQGLRASLR